MSTPENPPAFPLAYPTSGPGYGMTLRDYIAAGAIPALIARQRADIAWSEVVPTAYKIADAALIERAKNPADV